MRGVSSPGLVSLLLLWAGCDSSSRLLPPPPGPDAGPGDVCDPDDADQLLNDPRNCGACGAACSGEYADSCVRGTCSCGGQAVCAPGTGCRFGACVASDRQDPCEADGDCEPWQECVLDTQGERRCIAQCEFDSECFPGYACIEGACSFVTCVPEDCDARDNDCDGAVDEAAPRVPLSRYCFSGPAEVLETLSPTPPCRLGVQVCEPGGTWSSCEGEVPPYEEAGLLACDGLDNNCDTCPDGLWDGEACVPLTPAGYDVVFLIDSSGSMTSYIASVQASVREFAGAFDPSGPISFGIVVVDEPRPTLLLDLSPFGPFRDALDALPASGGGEEPSWDALWEVATGELSLSWTTGRARIIVLFTDEEGQSYRLARGVGLNITQDDICTSLLRGEAIFTLTKEQHYDDFDDCGEVRPLTESVPEMVGYLEEFISDPCLRRAAAP